MRDSTRTALVATAGCLATAAASARVHDAATAAIAAGVGAASMAAIAWTVRRARR